MNEPCDRRPDMASETVRLDKWLWAARFYKTRALAADAIDGGKVDVDGERARRSRLLAVGERVTVRKPPFEQHVIVRALSEQRGPAPFETVAPSESLQHRPHDVVGQQRVEKAALQRKAVEARPHGSGQQALPDARPPRDATAQRVFQKVIIAQQRRSAQQLQRAQARVADDVHQGEIA